MKKLRLDLDAAVLAISGITCTCYGTLATRSTSCLANGACTCRPPW